MFNIGPSSNMMDSLKKKMGGNTGVAGGMRRGPIRGPETARPQVMGRQQNQSLAPLGPATPDAPFGMGMPTPLPPRQEPVSTTMPVGRPRPQIIPFGNNGVGTPGEQPLQENQLWRTYSRLLGGPMGNMGSRMLL